MGLWPPADPPYLSYPHEQVRASLGTLHRAIDRAISLHDHRNVGGGLAEEMQELAEFEANVMMPVATVADLVFMPEDH